MSLFLSSEKISEFYASAGIREVINFWGFLRGLVFMSAF